MNDNKIWLNQNLLFYKDVEFNTDSVLDISLTSSTTDFKSFSSVALNIAISSFSTRKNQMLNLQNVMLIKRDLLELEDLDSTEKAEYNYKIQPDKLLIVGRTQALCFIKIKHSENDIISVACNINMMKVIITIFESFIENYLNLTLNISSRFLLSEILSSTKGVKDSVMTIPSSILDSVGSAGLIISEHHNIPSSDNLKKIEEVTNNFDEFLGKDMENISLDIPLKTSEPQNQMITEPSTILNRTFPSLRDFENFMFSVTSSTNTFKEITTRFSNTMKSGNFLPEIQLADLKSYLYISKSMYMHHLRQNTDFEIPLPASVPIIKYIGRGEEENILLAYDLLTVNLYIKLFRSRIELKDSNSMSNGSLFYLALRSFTDILVFSFIENIDKNMITSNIVSRFKYFKQINFFKEYELMLKKYDMNIEENDIRQVVTEMGDKVLGKTLPVGNLHDQYYKKQLLNVPYDNPFISDEIMTSIIPLQITALSDKEISEESLKNYSKGMMNTVANAMFGYFGKEDMAKTKTHARENNIVKTIKSFSDEIPYKYREQFIDKIQNAKDANIDSNIIGYPYEELGEHVLKAIYVWNEYNKKMPYDEFRQTIDNLTLQKNDIIVKFKGMNNITQDINCGSDNWFLE